MIMSTDNRYRSGEAGEGVSTGEKQVLVTSYCIEACAVVLINFLTIVTFTINRHLRKRSMYCVINLAVADMLFGIQETLSRVLMWKIHGPNMQWLDILNHNSMLWRVVVINVMAVATTFSLALTAVERMCAIVWPLRHRKAGAWVYTLAISMTWAVAAIYGLLLGIIISTMSSYRIPNLVSGLGIVVVVGVICVSYVVIFIHVKQQCVAKRDQKLAITLFIVSVASIGAYIPLALASLLTVSKVVVVPYSVAVAVVFLAFSNSLINPIIYVFRMKDFRKALLHLILTCSRDRPTPVVPQLDQQQAKQFSVRPMNKPTSLAARPVANSGV